MLIRTSFVCALGVCAVLTLTQPAAHAQSVIDEQNAGTWGIENNELNIPTGSIITQGTLSIHNASFVSTTGSETVFVHLLDNPNAGITEYTDSQTGDYFERYGIHLAQFSTSDLPAGPSDITLELGQITDASSAVWSVFGQPFTITTFPSATASQVSYSSALLELLDYAGTGRSFGFGLDCDGFAFSGLTLELTIESMDSSAPSATTATFSIGETAPEVLYTLTTTAANGIITRSPDKDTYTHGETVTLTVSANTGYTFAGWSGDATGTSDSVTVTMDGDKSVTANFAQNTYTLTTTAANGTITKSPNKISYTHGEVVTLTAATNAGYTFTGWGGDATGTSASVTVTMDGDKSVTANFAQNTYTLATTAANGTIIKSPNKAAYTYGEVVTLTVAANAGYTFSGWSGDAAGPSASVTITINSNKSVTANFTQNTYTLTTAATNGTITKSPNKITYTHGEVVTLTAAANAGYTFTGWSGDATGTSDSVTVTMDGDKSITANFAQNTYTLATTAANGTIIKSPNKAAYTYGEVVTLTVAANAGYTFSGWSGDAAGPSASVTITMNSNKSVTANFTQNTYTLTTAATNGTITKSPNKITYTHGEVVTLTAAANAGYTFTGWSGDATGTSASVTVIMNNSKSVTANFSNTNQAPLLNPIEDINITERDRLDFAVTAIDPDGDPVTITAEGLPDGATFDGSVFQWTPWYLDAGTYEIQFTASDGNKSDTITVTITVQPIKARDWYEKWIEHLKT